MSEDPFWDAAQRVCDRYEEHLCGVQWYTDESEEPDWSYTGIGGLILICPVSYLHLSESELEERLDRLLQKVIEEE